VPAHAAARQQNVSTRHLVDQLAHAPHVAARHLADDRELVGERDAHVAVRVLGGLDELGGEAIRSVELALHVRRVERDHRVGDLGR